MALTGGIIMADFGQGFLINPFICSTDEFTADRQYLHDEIFPQLQVRCQDRAGGFKPFEWDHNLSTDRLQTGLSLQLAMDCIQRAAPYFIGLVGDLYGDYRAPESATLPDSIEDLPQNADWIDKSLLYAAEYGYDWVLNEMYNSTSFFELKIAQAAFIMEDTSFCRFYIRQTDEELTASGYAKFRLQQLKSSLAKRGLHVAYFTTKEQLGELILRDWLEIIDRVYPRLDLEQNGTHYLYLINSQ